MSERVSKLIGVEVRYFDKWQAKEMTSVVVSSKEYENLAGNRKVFLTLENNAVIDAQSCWFEAETDSAN